MKSQAVEEPIQANEHTDRDIPEPKSKSKDPKSLIEKCCIGNGKARFIIGIENLLSSRL